MLLMIDTQNPIFIVMLIEGYIINGRMTNCQVESYSSSQQILSSKLINGCYS